MCGENDSWDKPGPPFQVFGNTYYVGTCGIASILITGDQGHVLIDGGTERGGELVEANITALGFDINDVAILLHSHEHYDHVGGLAYLQARSGGRVIASVRAAPVLRSGIVADDDPQARMHEPFPGVVVAATVSDGEPVKLGALTLTAIETPGHSPGALSWTWASCESEQCRYIAYLDSLSPVSRNNYRFSDDPDYLAAYRASLTTLVDIRCDVVLTPHPVASDMHRRLSEPTGLLDQAGCRNYVDRIERRLERRVSEERESALTR